MNGVDAGTAATRYRRDPAALRLAYTGILYGDRRDAKPLLRAAQGLGVPVSIDFYGSEPEIVGRLAAEFPGLAIADRGQVSRDPALRAPAQADPVILHVGTAPIGRTACGGRGGQYGETRGVAVPLK